MKKAPAAAKAGGSAAAAMEEARAATTGGSAAAASMEEAPAATAGGSATAASKEAAATEAGTSGKRKRPWSAEQIRQAQLQRMSNAHEETMHMLSQAAAAHKQQEQEQRKQAKIKKQAKAAAAAAATAAASTSAAHAPGLGSAAPPVAPAALLVIESDEAERLCPSACAASVVCETVCVCVACVCETVCVRM